MALTFAPRLSGGCGKISINAEGFEADVIERFLARMSDAAFRRDLATDTERELADVERRFAILGEDFADRATMHAGTERIRGRKATLEFHIQRRDVPDDPPSLTSSRSCSGGRAAAGPRAIWGADEADNPVGFGSRLKVDHARVSASKAYGRYSKFNQPAPDPADRRLAFVDLEHRHDAMATVAEHGEVAFEGKPSKESIYKVGPL
ncbi:hypothetical protein ACFTSD_24255 [Nocardiaceae bacterium NPDC056970]